MMTKTRINNKITGTGEHNDADYDEHDDEGVNATLLAYIVLQVILIIALSADVLVVTQLAALGASYTFRIMSVLARLASTQTRCIHMEGLSALQTMGLVIAIYAIGHNSTCLTTHIRNVESLVAYTDSVDQVEFG